MVWGVIWLIQAFIFFALGVIVGLVAFKKTAEEQREASDKFLPVPGSSGALATTPSSLLEFSVLAIGWAVSTLIL
ncbi:hypothetical protein VNI00_010978 [Paramarasmius palmivorus]|uniref:Uncharacterized protein n=1 Tax=Paramarasmius palmivorus TaxID=297713 RepID=A0AAW0CHN2_9AGAR